MKTLNVNGIRNGQNPVLIGNAVQWSPKVYHYPVIAEFLNEDGSDSLSETIEANYKRVKQEILSLVESEMERIKNDANLKHLIKE